MWVTRSVQIATLENWATADRPTGLLGDAHAEGAAVARRTLWSTRTTCPEGETTNFAWQPDRSHRAGVTP